MWYNVIMWAYPMLNLPILEGFMRFLPHRNGWIWGMVFNWVYHIKKARRNDVAGFVSHVGMMGLWHAHFISFYRHNFSRYWCSDKSEQGFQPGMTIFTNHDLFFVVGWIQHLDPIWIDLIFNNVMLHYSYYVHLCPINRNCKLLPCLYIMVLSLIDNYMNVLMF